MTISKCSGCRSLVYCTKNNIGFGSVECQSRMNFTPKKQPKPKPAQEPEKKGLLAEGFDALMQFGKKVGDLFGG